MKVIASVLVVAALAACGGGGNKSTGTSGSSGSSGANGAASGFCSKVATYDAQFKSASPSGDDIVRVYTDLAANAPSEIKADLEKLRDYATLRNSSDSDTASDSAAESASEAALNEAEAASKNFTDYVKTTCDIDLDSETSSKFSSVASSIN